MRSFLGYGFTRMTKIGGRQKNGGGKMRRIFQPRNTRTTRKRAGEGRRTEAGAENYTEGTRVGREVTEDGVGNRSLTLRAANFRREKTEAK